MIKAARNVALIGPAKVKEPAHDTEHSDMDIEQGFNDLMRVEEMKRNKPNLMKKIYAHAAKKKKVITSIADLKKRAQELADREAGAPEEMGKDQDSDD